MHLRKRNGAGSTLRDCKVWQVWRLPLKPTNDVYKQVLKAINIGYSRNLSIGLCSERLRFVMIRAAQPTAPRQDTSTLHPTMAAKRKSVWQFGIQAHTANTAARLVLFPVWGRTAEVSRESRSSSPVASARSPVGTVGTAASPRRSAQHRL